MDKIFTLPDEPYLKGSTERVIEVPWALSCIGDANRVLDVGTAYAEGVYLDKLFELGIEELHTIDFADVPRRNHRIYSNSTFIKWDVRDELPYTSDYFDVILCISTIEHVGCKNTAYVQNDINRNNIKNQDVTSMRNLIRVLRPGGIIVLTVPYGQYESVFVHSSFVNYNKSRLEFLYADEHVELVRKNIFKNVDGWISANEKDVERTKYYNNDHSKGAGAIACCIITKE